MSARVTYVAMRGEEYRTLKEEEVKAYDEGNMEKLSEVDLKTSSVEWTFLEVYGINRGRDAEDLRGILLERYANPACSGGDEALLAAAESLYEHMNIREIGEKDGLCGITCAGLTQRSTFPYWGSQGPALNIRMNIRMNIRNSWPEMKSGRIIGLCLDAEDGETMAEGRKILSEAGVSYLNIVPFEGREEMLPNKVYPTTVFVDENGILFDDVVSGAAVELYPVTLDKLLNR